MSGVMRRILVFMVLILVFMMSCVSYALASTNDEAKIKSTLNNTGISQPVQLSQWGDTAACFAETDGVKRLILLERHNGAWQIEIDNPTALIQDRDWPQLLLDSDNAVFWTYILSCRIRRSCGITVTAMRTADGVRWISSTATAASVNTPISGTRPGTV